jgi:hypothetical protein
MDDMTAKYRELFLKTNLGREVLADILQMCHFGETLDPENMVRVSEYNVGVAVLHKCGILAEDTLEDVTRALANITPKNPQEDDET